METKPLAERSLLSLLFRMIIILVIGLLISYGYAWLIVHYCSRTTTDLVHHAYPSLA